MSTECYSFLEAVYGMLPGLSDGVKDSVKDIVYEVLGETFAEGYEARLQRARRENFRPVSTSPSEVSDGQKYFSDVAASSNGAEHRPQEPTQPGCLDGVSNCGTSLLAAGAAADGALWTHHAVRPAGSDHPGFAHQMEGALPWQAIPVKLGSMGSTGAGTSLAASANKTQQKPNTP